MRPFDKLRANGWGRIAVLCALLFALALPASAQTFPKFTGLVVDDANVLPPETEADLTAKLEALQRDTNRQLVVATIADMQGYPLEDYGYRLGRAWGVGLKDVNNGAILFIAPNNPAGQRGPRIEVGRGLEPILTDALSSVIINNEMMPRLRENGDIPGAMTTGADAIIAQLRASPDEAKARTDAAVAEFDRTHRRHTSAGGGFPWPVLLPIGIVLFFMFVGAASSRRGRRYRGGDGGSVWPIVLWSIADELSRGSHRSGGSSWGGSDWGGGDGGGGWGGGGFSGGGGGSFGGGGASGSW
ncbi:TPM domain-containing protein [Sphingomonas sp. DT-204]|uniref:TPM domain-containing protein n=1 Tax=Sphingomonas sp. DT-204 TaxID=3396166 RepID=UPI003F1D7336